MITGRCEVSSSAIIFTLSPAFVEKNKINPLYFKHKGFKLLRTAHLQNSKADKVQRNGASLQRLPLDLF